MRSRFYNINEEFKCLEVEGDAEKNDARMDEIVETSSSFALMTYQFAVAGITFNDHAIHHLFRTILSHANSYSENGGDYKESLMDMIKDDNFMIPSVLNKLANNICFEILVNGDKRFLMDVFRLFATRFPQQTKKEYTKIKTYLKYRA